MPSLAVNRRKEVESETGRVPVDLSVLIPSSTSQAFFLGCDGETLVLKGWGRV